ncbi:MAG: type II toxin-antitoxin system RelE family toxin [Spirochaetaceae bacterium]
MRYRVTLTKTAAEALQRIEKRARKQIINKLRDLEINPLKRGSPLLGELQGYRDVRAAEQRYRIIYTVEEDRVVVLVVYVGIRKDGDKNDVYSIAKKLIRAGLIDRK